MPKITATWSRRNARFKSYMKRIRYAITVVDEKGDKVASYVLLADGHVDAMLQATGLFKVEHPDKDINALRVHASPSDDAE
jgi:hypothetical protein